ncbi:sigma-70 family RNA polymerase sigma factor [Spirosoma sp. HMF4905]|uniref:Sigma-70 family RNA polymerase sigma factor n=1 Tax=Spirosoma arboris TaxID=2682092 RepID=A0A7K1S3Z2_9BACT|nr:sigma-70 family RNA polymerase sigma factor [Spirosoma arboris]MVM28537.1 sigma-70 family RNA polymerase sigma factor [Spirosoma arboris]
MSEYTVATELWTAFKKGDKEAYGNLVALFYKTLYNYGTKLTRDKTVVEDCIQDLFLELWQRREYLSETEYVRFYLLKSLRRKIYAQQSLQQKWLHQSLETNTEGEFLGEFSIETRMIEVETTEHHLKKLNQLLGKLTRREREVIYLKFYQELDYEQIAAIMSINYQSVRNLIYTAIKELQSAWFEE